MTDQYDIELRIASDPRYLCVSRQVVSTLLDRLGADAMVCGQVTLAVDEAVSNVMRHGYEGRCDQPIWIKLRCDEQRDPPCLEIVVEDLGRQVDPEAIRGRDLEDIRPGGLGVHIIRQIMDAVDYTQRTDGGMRLAMTKCLRSSEPKANAEAR